MMVKIIVTNVTWKRKSRKMNKCSLSCSCHTSFRVDMLRKWELRHAVLSLLNSSEDSSTSGFLCQWLFKSITPSLTTVSVRLMPSFPFAPFPPIKLFVTQPSPSVALFHPVFHNLSLSVFHSQTNSIELTQHLLLLSLNLSFLYQSIHPPLSSVSPDTYSALRFSHPSPALEAFFLFPHLSLETSIKCFSLGPFSASLSLTICHLQLRAPLFVLPTSSLTMLYYNLLNLLCLYMLVCFSCFCIK